MGSTDTNLKRCRCNFNPDFPGLHGPNCPAARRPRAAVPGDGLEPPEDRGTHYRVWYGRGDRVSFSPFPEAFLVHEISVPIGWHLAQHEKCGVVFRRLAQPSYIMTAEDTLEAVGLGEHGFREVARHDIFPPGFEGPAEPPEEPAAEPKVPDLSDPCNSPALAFKSPDYPVRFGGRVPKKVLVTKSVASDMNPDFRISYGLLVWVSVNSHGAVSAIVGGQLLGLKPDEFEVVEWHLVPREDSLAFPQETRR